jgi:DNA-binding transcriptional regulator LsrR (DeoR family)/DNA-binding XRE family transcriptional regulator
MENSNSGIKVGRGFPKKFAKFRKELGLNQEQMGELLNRHQAVISRWENDNNSPGWIDLENMLNLWGRHKVLDLLSIDYDYEHLGVKWVEEIPAHAGEKAGQIELGIEFFKTVFVDNIGTDEIASKKESLAGYNTRDLYIYFQAAVRCGALRLTEVPRDEEWEKKLRDRFSILGKGDDDIIVAKIPNKNDGTPIRAEFVAFLAATQALAGLNNPRRVGFGSGYTILRTVEQTFPGIYTNTDWLPLASHARDDTTNSYRSANHIALTMAARNPRSRPHNLFFYDQDSEEATNRNSVFAEKIRQSRDTLSLAENADAIFMSVNGYGRRNRSLSLEEAPMGVQLRSADLSEGKEMRELLQLLQKRNLLDEFAGELLGLFLDIDGNIVGDGEIEANLRAITYQVNREALKRVAEVARVWIVAAREYKAKPTLMALNSKLANCLVIDSEIAEWLWKNTDRQGRPL